MVDSKLLTTQYYCGHQLITTWQLQELNNELIFFYVYLFPLSIISLFVKQHIYHGLNL